MRTQFGTNIVEAQRKRVYYTEASTIYEGMPVCYEFDATANVLGYDKGAGGRVDSQSTPNTTAEGNQNEGKYLRVEDVDDDNLHAFAGVIAGTSEAGKAGPRWVDIFIPNDAIVPVRTDQTCVCGQTVLAINNAEAHLTAPHGAGRTVAVAWETVDREPTTGIVLAQLSPNRFLYQIGDGNHLLVDDTDTAWQRVNSIGIECAGSQWLEALCVSVDFLAAGTNTGIAIIGEINSYQTASTGASTAIQGQVYFQSGFVSTAGDYRGLGAKVKDEATVDLSGMNLACLYLEHYIRAASTGPANSAMIRCNATEGANAPDYFLYGQNPGSLAMTISAATAGTKTCAIKCSCAGLGIFYLRGYSSAV